MRHIIWKILKGVGNLKTELNLFWIKLAFDCMRQGLNCGNIYKLNTYLQKFQPILGTVCPNIFPTALCALCCIHLQKWPLHFRHPSHYQEPLWEAHVNTDLKWREGKRSFVFHTAHIQSVGGFRPILCLLRKGGRVTTKWIVLARWWEYARASAGLLHRQKCRTTGISSSRSFCPMCSPGSGDGTNADTAAGWN